MECMTQPVYPKKYVAVVIPHHLTPGANSQIGRFVSIHRNNNLKMKTCSEICRLNCLI